MWHPTALAARQHLSDQQELTAAAPSPGDRLLDGSPVVLPPPDPADDR